MSRESELLARIASAEAHIRSARESWNPASSAACTECADHLQQAVVDMNAAGEAAADGSAPFGTKARLDRLRADGAVLSRLVDSALAFTRGLALRAGSAEMIGSEVRG